MRTGGSHMAETRIIIKGSIARKLLKLGYTIVDIYPQRRTDGTYDYTRSSFVFAYEDGIDEKIAELTTK